MTAAERFARARQRVHRALPEWVRRRVPETVIGFAALNSLTYSIDLLLLFAMTSALAVPYPVATTIAYAIALTLAFVLNRWLNFQSHGDVGRQGGRYVLTVVVNYLVFLLGLGTWLEATLLPAVPSRMIAGACEGIFMYCAMRWFVFDGPDQGARR